MRSPFKFARHGQCGMWVSDAMPHLARHVDDLALIRSMYTTNLTHEPALYLIQSGKMAPGPADARLVGRLRPGQREPEPAGLRRARRPAGPADQRRRELAGRLPAAAVPGHALPLDRLAGAEPAARRRAARRTSCRRERDLLARLDQHAQARSGPASRTSTPASPATSWPPACSWRRPTRSTSRRRRAATLEMYGIGREPTDSYGRRCLIARRLVERGVRFVQLYINAQIWDNHTRSGDRAEGRLRPHRPADRRRCLRDLKQRGLLDEHAGRLGRRVRPAADRPAARRQGRAQGRPRPQQERLLHLDGRRRRQGRARPTARPTSSAWPPSRTASASPTGTPRSCTCSGLHHEELFVEQNGLKEQLTGVERAHVVKEILA